MNTSLKKALTDSSLACLLASVSFGLVGPVSLYISNQSEFTFYLTDILPALISCTVICFAVLMAICALIRNDKARAVVTACILGVGIGFYVQSSFMSGGYGQLNGLEIDWASMW